MRTTTNPRTALIKTFRFTRQTPPRSSPYKPRKQRSNEDASTALSLCPGTAGSQNAKFVVYTVISIIYAERCLRGVYSTRSHTPPKATEIGARVKILCTKGRGYPYRMEAVPFAVFDFRNLIKSAPERTIIQVICTHKIKSGMTASTP